MSSDLGVTGAGAQPPPHAVAPFVPVAVGGFVRRQDSNNNTSPRKPVGSPVLTSQRNGAQSPLLGSGSSVVLGQNTLSELGGETSRGGMLPPSELSEEAVRRELAGRGYDGGELYTDLPLEMDEDAARVELPASFEYYGNL